MQELGSYLDDVSSFISLFFEHVQPLDLGNAVKRCKATSMQELYVKENYEQNNIHIMAN